MCTCLSFISNNVFVCVCVWVGGWLVVFVAKDPSRGFAPLTALEWNRKRKLTICGCHRRIGMKWGGGRWKWRVSSRREDMINWRGKEKEKRPWLCALCKCGPWTKRIIAKSNRHAQYSLPPPYWKAVSYIIGKKTWRGGFGSPSNKSKKRGSTEGWCSMSPSFAPGSVSSLRCRCWRWSGQRSGRTKSSASPTLWSSALSCRRTVNTINQSVKWLDKLWRYLPIRYFLIDSLIYLSSLITRTVFCDFIDSRSHSGVSISSRWVQTISRIDCWS